MENVMPMAIFSLKRRKTMNLALLEEEEDTLQVLLNSIFTLGSERHNRPPNYEEEFVDRYSDLDFFRLFRMQRSTFDNILQSLVTDGLLTSDSFQGLPPVTPSKKLLMTISYLSSQDSYRKTGDKFNVADSTVFNAVKETISALCQKSATMIKWPCENEATQIEQQFRDFAAFPGVIGAVDGTHIEVKVPKEHTQDYTNRKYRQTVILQGICTQRKLFTNINVGYPGRAHDARVFRSSILWATVQQHGPLSMFYRNDFHLLGDSAYPLQVWLMKPYPRDERTTPQQTYFNKRLSAARVSIENAFGWLKLRWKRLDYVDSKSFPKISDIITACCVLHNMCLFEGDLPTGTWRFEEVPDEPDHGDEEQLEANQKRDHIKDTI